MLSTTNDLQVFMSALVRQAKDKETLSDPLKVYGLAKAGTTILVTTHYMDEAARCTRLAFLSRGRLIAVGTQEEITRHFGTATVEDAFIELQRRDEQSGANAHA